MAEQDSDTKQTEVFICQRCSQCCHGQGGIFYDPEDIPAAAATLGMAVQEFIARFCAPEGGRYSVLTTKGGDCRLLGPEGCMVHEAKPEICRRWPFFQNIVERASAFEEAKLACPGIREDCTHAEFRDYWLRHVQQESEQP